MIKKTVSLVEKIARKTISDELLPLANQLTYKILLAFFPFLIFLMTVLGFINIDANILLDRLSQFIPSDVLSIVRAFTGEVFNQRNISLLSISLITTIISASSGFKAVIRGVNKTFDHHETRNTVTRHALAFLLMLVFVVAIIAALSLIIFQNTLIQFFTNFTEVSDAALRTFDALSSAMALVILLIATTVIYKYASCKPIKFFNLLPGAAFTVFFWVLFSKLFNIYVANFSNYSNLYGSIGNVFVLMIWLNTISMVLLIGSEINASIF